MIIYNNSNDLHTSASHNPVALSLSPWNYSLSNIGHGDLAFNYHKCPAFHYLKYCGNSNLPKPHQRKKWRRSLHHWEGPMPESTPLSHSWWQIFRLFVFVFVFVKYSVFLYHFINKCTILFPAISSPRIYWSSHIHITNYIAPELSSEQLCVGREDRRFGHVC